MRRIAKNSAYLYVRMLITTFITFFSTRIILENLGVIDYGVYNVIAGAIMLFSFFNNAMTSSTERHLSFEIERGTHVSLKNTFNASLRIHLVIAMVVLILSETIGLYFVETALKIPDDRMEAALWVYHCVVLIFFTNIISVPYQAVTNAHEDMHVIATRGICESIGRLVIAYMLMVVSADKLKFYGISMLLLTLAISISIYWFCKRNYQECKVDGGKIDKKLYIKLTGFAQWTLFGSLSSLARKQGSTIILNIFFGPAINAAFGIANQIANQIGIFSITLLKAVNPQIVKNFGKDDTGGMLNLVFVSSRFSFFLFSIISIPLFLEMDFIVDLWLHDVPEYAVLFSRLILINVLIDVLIGPMITAIQATAKIKAYQIISGCTYLLNLPVIYVLFKFNFSPEVVILSNIFFTIMVGCIRLYFLNNLIGLSILSWVNDVLVKCGQFMIFSIVLIFPIYQLFENNGMLRLSVIAASSVLICSILVYLIGINSEEKTVVKKFFVGKLRATI